MLVGTPVSANARSSGKNDIQPQRSTNARQLVPARPSTVLPVTLSRQSTFSSSQDVAVPTVRTRSRNTGPPRPQGDSQSTSRTKPTPPQRTSLETSSEAAVSQRTSPDSDASTEAAVTKRTSPGASAEVAVASQSVSSNTTNAQDAIPRSSASTDAQDTMPVQNNTLGLPPVFNNGGIQGDTVASNDSPTLNLLLPVTFGVLAAFTILAMAFLLFRQRRKQASPETGERPPQPARVHSIFRAATAASATSTSDSGSEILGQILQLDPGRRVAHRR
ncbi:MAG: hypothetical protein SGCHY_001009 [Lobulomycetales sp.]